MKKKKIHSLNRVWTTEEGSSHRQLLTIAETNRKKNNSSSGKDFTKKPWTLFPRAPSPNALFLSVKAFSFPCQVGTCTWLPMIEDTELQFSADPELTYLDRRKIW